MPSRRRGCPGGQSLSLCGLKEKVTKEKEPNTHFLGCPRDASSVRPHTQGMSGLSGACTEPAAPSQTSVVAQARCAALQSKLEPVPGQASRQVAAFKRDRGVNERVFRRSFFGYFLSEPPERK
jgi:hypothetical protein